MSKGKIIPLSIPNIGEQEVRFVTDAVRGTWVSSAGADIKCFEDEFARFLGLERACACQSGTAALHLCLRHYGIGPDDIVLVPTLTFIATINPIIYQGAEPIFFDCDDHLCIDVDQVEAYLKSDCVVKNGKTIDCETGKTVRAIIPVHVFGEYADMVRLMEIAERHHLIVIEDATESLGTQCSSGRFTGTLGHAAAFSFNGNKIMTTGGGGMIVSKDSCALEHMRYLSQQAKDDPIYFVNNEIGYNYRMTNMQAALGRAQLMRLPIFIETKRSNYRLYQHELEDSPYSLLPFKDFATSNCWFYSLITGVQDYEVRDNLIVYLTEHGIQSRPIWKLNHLQVPFLGCRAMPTPRAEFWYNTVVNVPCSTSLTADEVRHVCSIIKDFARHGK